MSDFMIRFLICNILFCGIISILLLMKHILKNCLSSRMQYNLWFLLLGLLTVPFLPSHFFKFSELFFGFTNLKFLPSAATKNASAPPLHTNIAGAKDWMDDFALSVNEASSSAIGYLLFTLWILGIIIMIILAIRSALFLHSLKKSASPLEDQDVQKLYRRCLNDTNITKSIPVYSAAYLKSPVIAGFWKPCIFLPVHLISDKNETDIRYMLLHELQHYKHKDGFINYLINLAGMIYWFNPFVWYALKEMPGDIWTVGKHRVMCGDATSPEDVEKLMDGKNANLVLTDPPYGVSFKASDGLTIKNDSLKGEEFYKFLLAAFKNMADHLEKGGAAYCFHADTEGLTFRKAFIDAGFHLAGVCIWVKNSLVLGRSDYQWQHEPVLYGFLQNGKHPWYSDRKQTTIWNYDKPKRNKDHPTSKPLDLLGYPIQNSSQENSVVIDTFGGSGSTLMACEQLNRVCYMMELDPKYASVILRRYVEDTGDEENVYVIRNGEKLLYSALAKEVETSPTAGV